MNSKKDHKLTILFAISCLLMTSAIMLISISFGAPKENTIKDWNIYIEEVVTDLDYTYNNSLIEYKVELNKPGSTNEIKYTIHNKGEYDAILDEIIKTDLDKIEVGTINNHTYYLSDYIVTTIEYYLTNKTNNIKENDYLKSGDLLKKKTFNDIIIKLRYKNTNELNDEMNLLIKDNPLLSFYMNVGLKYNQRIEE